MIIMYSGTGDGFFSSVCWTCIQVTSNKFKLGTSLEVEMIHYDYTSLQCNKLLLTGISVITIHGPLCMPHLSVIYVN